ncbi:hypothetical protein, partial [Pantoea sp. Morm]|uniref:hypothetical protein n=1 Tax=Pantoea sp. Morm TaxID=2601250 RepID=UPI0031FCA4E8
RGGAVPAIPGAEGFSLHRRFVQKGVKCTPVKTFCQVPQKLFAVAPLCPLFVDAPLPFAATGSTET